MTKNFKKYKEPLNMVLLINFIVNLGVKRVPKKIDSLQIFNLQNETFQKPPNPIF